LPHVFLLQNWLVSWSRFCQHNSALRWHRHGLLDEGHMVSEWTRTLFDVRLGVSAVSSLAPEMSRRQAEPHHQYTIGILNEKAGKSASGVAGTSPLNGSLLQRYLSMNLPGALGWRDACIHARLVSAMHASMPVWSSLRCATGRQKAELSADVSVTALSSLNACVMAEPRFRAVPEDRSPLSIKLRTSAFTPHSANPASAARSSGVSAKGG
jgi:hypothetical protein